MTFAFIVLIVLAAIGFILFEKFRGNNFFNKINRILTINDNPSEAGRNEDELFEPNIYRLSHSEEKDYEIPLDIAESEEVDNNGVLLPPDNTQ